MYLSSLVHNIPSVVAANSLANAYAVKFPDGIQHTLVKLKQGGYMSFFKDGNGKFGGTASLYKLESQAAMLGIFSAMAVASSQYFLTQINNELKMINMNIDKILEFLYGNMKAELIAEVSFVQYAYQNFDSIMSSNDQVSATISSLQSSKKIAMKDIEFYLTDLDSTVNNKDDSMIDKYTEKALQLKGSLELAMQLYGVSSILELYYSQNFNPSLVQFIEKQMSFYIDKCEKRMLSCFSVLNNRLTNQNKNRLFAKKSDMASHMQTVKNIVCDLGNAEESSLRTSFRTILHGLNKCTEYYVTNDGDVFLKKAA